MRVTADVEESGARRGPDAHDAGGEVVSGEHDDHAVHVGEQPERLAFVLHAVLHAHDRLVGHAGGAEVVEHADGVLALDAEHEHVVVGDVDLADRRDDGQLDGPGAGGRLVAQPRLAHHPRVLAAGDGHDRRARHCEVGGDDPADCSGTDHDDPHGARLWDLAEVERSRRPDRRRQNDD